MILSLVRTLEGFLYLLVCLFIYYFSVIFTGWSQDGYNSGRGGTGRPEQRNSRWEEPEANDNNWTVPLPRNERLEMELFGDADVSSGINFDKYEDIPVEATGDNVPSHINDVSLI